MLQHVSVLTRENQTWDIENDVKTAGFEGWYLLSGFMRIIFRVLVVPLKLCVFFFIAPPFQSDFYCLNSAWPTFREGTLLKQREKKRNQILNIFGVVLTCD